MYSSGVSLNSEQAESYCKMMSTPLIIDERMQRTCKFGSRKKASLGATKFWIPYGGNHMMDICLDVFYINIPLLLGLDKLDEHKL